jgi:hypothetical protein
MNQAEHDKSLMVVAAAEGYAGRHGMSTADAFALLLEHGVTEAIRQCYNTLHTQCLSESVYFAEDMLSARLPNGSYKK